MFNEIRNQLKKINEEIKNTQKTDLKYKNLLDKKIEIKKEILKAKEKYYGEMASKIDAKLRKKRNHHIFELGGTVEKILGEISKEDLELLLINKIIKNNS